MVNALEPRGKEVDIHMFMDSDHAEDKLSCRSKSYFLTALVQWFSKKQSTVETSVFGSEFVATKQGINALMGLRYKLRVMGILIIGPLYFYWDNKSFVHNTSNENQCMERKAIQFVVTKVC